MSRHCASASEERPEAGRRRLQAALGEIIPMIAIAL
jgi:hypothetical protein